MSARNFSDSVAAELYESALSEDPDYAPAWARLGRVYRVMAKYGMENVDGYLQRAEHAFRRSLEINPDLSIAHNHYTNFEVESLGRAREAMARLLTRARSQASCSPAASAACWMRHSPRTVRPSASSRTFAPA